MTPGFIIDGYNLMHRIPELAGLVEYDLERARDRLVTRLAVFKSRKKIRMVVVFDGDRSSGQAARSRTRGIEVVFSRLPDKADQRIVKMVRVLKHPRGWTVVSSDRWVMEHSGAHRANTMPAEEFAQLLAPMGKGKLEAEPEKPEMKPEDVAEWEEYFRKAEGKTARGRTARDAKKSRR